MGRVHHLILEMMASGKRVLGLEIGVLLARNMPHVWLVEVPLACCLVLGLLMNIVILNLGAQVPIRFTTTYEILALSKLRTGVRRCSLDLVHPGTFGVQVWICAAFCQANQAPMIVAGAWHINQPDLWELALLLLVRA